MKDWGKGVLKKALPLQTSPFPSQRLSAGGEAARQESLSDGQRDGAEKGGCAGSLRIALAPFQRRFEGGMG